MSFEFTRYWERLCKANPSLSKTGKLTISIESFRASIEKAFSNGRLSAQAEQITKPDPLKDLRNLFR